MEFVINKTGALQFTGRPSAFKHLVNKNISTAENDTMRPARDMVKKPIPDGASGILKAVTFERATIGKLETSVRNEHPLMKYVEEDTKPHVIEAKNKKSLAFKVKGKLVFAKKVNHPGTKGKYSFLHAWEFFQGTIQPSVQQSIDAAFEGKPYGSGTVSRTSPTAIRI
jgi:hypothetical protein